MAFRNMVYAAKTFDRVTGQEDCLDPSKEAFYQEMSSYIKKMHSTYREA